MKRRLVVALLALAFVAGALAQARWVNVDATTHDQSAYLAQARMLAETHFSVPTNRIEMPAFPALLSVFYRDGLDDEAWFWRAKLVSIGVSFLCALAMALTLRRMLARDSARLATIAIVFFVFMFRAAYVQTEPLYYLLSCWAVFAIDRLWREPSFLRAFLAGGLVGAAWLAKASILVCGIVALPLFLVRETITCARKRLFATLVARVAMGATAALAFIAVVAPYATTTHRLQGRWLYNMSPAYVMWCDSWEDFVDHMRRLGPVEGWAALPDQSEVPSMAHYLSSHSVGQMAWRTIAGSGLVFVNLLTSPFGPIVLLTTIALGALLARTPLFSRLPWRDPRSGVWFVAYFVVHATLQGFYAPIAAGPRFSIAIALPAFVLLLRALDRHADAQAWARARSWMERATWVLLFTAVPIAALELYCGG